MRGLHSVAWRGLKRRRARSILTGIAIALGVANVFGVFSTNASIDRGVASQTLTYGGSDVAAGIARPKDVDTSVIADMKPRLTKLPGVEDVSFTFGGLPLDAPEPMSDTEVALAAHDPVARRFFFSDRLIEGRLPRPDTPEAAVSRGSASALGVDIGDVVTSHRSTFLKARKELARNPGTRRLADAMPETLTFRVTGIVRDPPAIPDNVCCGSVTSLEYLWRITGIRTVTGVGFDLADDVEPDDWVRLRQQEIPELQFNASEIGPESKRLLGTIKGTLSGTSALALFIGAFLIYLTFSISVVERTRLFGTFHAIGASGRNVAAGVLTEALAIGVISTMLGLALGYGLSYGLARLVARIVPVAVSTAPTLTAPGILASVLVGLVATLAGAAVPALRAARMSPVQAIRGNDAVIGGPSRTWIAGVALVGLGAAFALTDLMTTNVLTVFATLGVLLGSILLVPPVLGVIARAVRRVAARLTPGLSDVAVGHVTRERNRSGHILGLLMVVLAAILALSTTDRSLHRVTDTWIDKRFGADLILNGPEMTPAVERKLERVPGVSGVTSVDFGSNVEIIAPARVVQNLVLIEPDDFFDIAGFPWSEGTDDGVRKALRRGGSVLITSRVAGQLGVQLGDTLRLRFAGREEEFGVGGIYVTLGGGPEVGVVASMTDAAFFQPDKYRDAIYLNFSGVESQRTMERRLAPVLAADGDPGTTWRPAEHGSGRLIGSYYAITGADLKAHAQEDLSAFLRVFLAVVLIAAVVGILGMANTLAASVLMRFREIGVLQAVGATPRAVRRMVIAESAILTMAAFVLSLLLGALLSWMFNQGTAVQIGFDVPFVFAWRTIPVLAVLSAVIAFVAAFVPARRAERLTPVEALRYE